MKFERRSSLDNHIPLFRCVKCGASVSKTDRKFHYCERDRCFICQPCMKAQFNGQKP